MLKIKPRLAIFDLDRTLWPFGIDEFVFRPPYKLQGNQVFDNNGAKMNHFPEVLPVLNYLKSEKIFIAIASRTTYPSGAKSLLDLFKFTPFIKYSEVYPTSKIRHFHEINIKSKIPYGEMIFFDDEERNIDDISDLGVFSVLVNPETGITKSVLLTALEKYEIEKRESNVK